jgi:glycosyltransferase involved in cell wall biosynthesis
MATTLTASVVITTKNRKDELRDALKSAVAQSAQPEVIVIDDGSNDGTSEMVRAEFPQVQLHRFESSRGLVVRRNEGARLAKGDIIFSIDDDAVFSANTIVAQTLADFAVDLVGAVAIPFIDVKKDGALQQKAPDSHSVWTTHTYIGTAHAVRRELFNRLGGYREYLIHQGEESDFCIRMLASGHRVRLGNAEPIHHFESPKRDLSRMDYYGCRNNVLFAWQNVPAPILPVYLLATTWNCLRWTLVPRRLSIRGQGLLVGYLKFWGTERRPVPMGTYLRWRELKKKGPLPTVEGAEGVLAP